MSPVFRHGGLRLYLLKLLDEAPRHGYDVIRLLQDRFLGVYSPSPGTIYPRLARLEEEGLVTHEVVDGKKVYRITDAGREELNSRLDDLADLEDELTASVRDIAREITRDVRETVRSLRDEFTWPSGGWREWADWAERRDWREWADWAEQRDWREWTSKQEWKDRAKASHKEWKEWAKAGKQEWAAGGAGRRDADRDLIVDLERLAGAFARELRGVAWQAEALSEDAVGNLGRILTDALNRIRNEVFRPPGPGKEDS